MNLEAAHIWPRSHKGLYLPSNGIALCRDMHWAFDKGMFTVDDNLTVNILGLIQDEKVKWLQNNNPEVPGLIYKLAPLDEKMPKLSRVRKLWERDYLL